MRNRTGEERRGALVGRLPGAGRVEEGGNQPDVRLRDRLVVAACRRVLIAVALVQFADAGAQPVERFGGAVLFDVPETDAQVRGVSPFAGGEGAGGEAGNEVFHGSLGHRYTVAFSAVTDASRHWVRDGIDEAAYAALADDLAASELWSLLLDVLERRALQRSPPDLLRQWSRDLFTRPAAIDQRTLVALDGHLLAAASAFEAIELSPLAPLGVCSRTGLASQNKVVSALRGTEVVSDPTNVLALECAHRLRIDPLRDVRLATCQRVVRAQAQPKRPGFSQHFRIFCLASAGRARASHGFLVEALIEHIRTHLAALDLLEKHGYGFPGRRVRLLATDARAPLADRIAEGLGGDTPIARAPLQHAYYDGVRFMIDVDGPDGAAVPLIDGGAFDWLGALTSNHKLEFVASGMGAQLAATLFRRPTG
jgi:hypothetical protein